MHKTFDVVSTSCVEQHAGADHVGVQEHRRIADGTIDVALRGEVHHDIVTRHQSIDQVGVADVALNEGVPVAGVQLGNGRLHPGIGE